MKAVVTVEFGLFADIRDDLPLTIEAAKVVAAQFHLLADTIFNDELASVHRINLNSVTFHHGVQEDAT